ncbi:heat shock factor protein 5-like [Lathamus discolor]|uniref:heat shock factor protein 5-like n=1 Tax=Lathamus discolor TaxID=678569 RepID=UPI0032B84D88
MGPGLARRPVERERPVRPLAGSAMEGLRLPGAVNPRHFPAKLWQLVNSPRCGSVRWDARGEGLVVDRRLFERELLGAEPAGEGAALGPELFKTRSFANFLRQLNLYGFRRLGPGPGPGPGPLQDPAGDIGGSSAGPLLHFQSPHFRRGRPELLVRLKRLTSAKKAKLAAGPELPSRPPQRPQRPPSTLGEAARPGLVTVGQAPQPCHPGSFFPSSDRAASCQDPPAFQATTSQQPPVPSRPWQGSVGSLPGHGASPALPGQGAPFPVLHKCSTAVTYTLRTVCSLLPLQRGAPAGASVPDPASCASPGQCLQAPDPTRTAKCCSPPGQGGPLTVSTSAAASTDCAFVQSPEVQPPSAAECLPSDGAHHASEDVEKLPELSYEDVFQFFKEMRDLRGADVVTPEPAESWDGELFDSYIRAAIESAAAAESVQDAVTTQGAREEQGEQLDHNPARPSKMFLVEGLFSAAQENANVRCESVTEERELTSGPEAVNKPAAEEAGSSVKPRCRKRRQSSRQDPQEPEGGACKRGCFWRKTAE